jgi:hypothetical protein
MHLASEEFQSAFIPPAKWCCQCEDGRQDHEYSVMVIAEAASVGVSDCTPLRWKNIDN